MTRLGWTASLLMTLGLGLGIALGWGLCRAVPGGAGRIIQVARVPPYEPVEIVPESVDWPQGEPVTVATVEPPTKRQARKLEKDFNFRVGRDSLLGKFDLPQLPDGGSAIVTASKPDGDDPEPVKLTMKVNKPPLLRIRWEPEVSFWYGVPQNGGWGDSYATYLSLGNLACVRDKLCAGARAGYESRGFAGGWVVELGASWRL